MEIRTKIEAFDPSLFIHRRMKGVSKYQLALDEIATLPIGKQIRIRLEQPNNYFGSYMQTYFKVRKCDFSLKTHKEDARGREWVIAKLDAKVGKAMEFGRKGIYSI